MIFDTFTLFAANAVVAAVMACAFGAAWLQRRDAVFWPTWIVAQAAIVGAILAFMALRSGAAPFAAPMANLLAVAGYGVRWRAVRQFGGRTAPWMMPVLIPGFFLGVLFLAPAVLSYEAAYCAANGVLAVQALACLYEVWRDRADGLSSRYGLVASYGLIGAMFGLRALQGVVVGYDMSLFLPHDGLLEVHLVAGLIHTVGAGAFFLSLAYERSAADLRRIALCDELTGLGNRRAFQMRLSDAMPLGAGRGCAIALFDIDHFKLINDRHGHAAGDEALRRCAQVIGASLRQSDMVARIGGEEFAALLKDVSLPEARAIVERVRQTVEACEIDVGGPLVRLTISVGLFYAPLGALDFEWAMRKADASLYKAKLAGRNRVELAA